MLPDRELERQKLEKFLKENPDRPWTNVSRAKIEYCVDLFVENRLKKDPEMFC